MSDFTENNLTDAVLARLDGASSPRFKQIMSSLIRHMHDFVRDVELTEAEWFEAIKFLTATGQKCDDKRQEFILLSDTLGVSMLVDAINHRKPGGATESTVFGPFYVNGSVSLPKWANIADGVKGEPAFVSGQVKSVDGKPIAGAQLDLWQTDGEGFYDVQLPNLGGMQARGKITTDAGGHYGFRTVKPVSYPIPTDGPVGNMLNGMGRHPYRPAHIHAIVSAPGFEPVTTHVFVKGDPYLQSDAVFGVKNSLVTEFVKRQGNAPDGSKQSTPFWEVHYDFALASAK
jgi:hydroxyquinol 1,2-dioxygenase